MFLLLFTTTAPIFAVWNNAVRVGDTSQALALYVFKFTKWRAFTLSRLLRRAMDYVTTISHRYNNVPEGNMQTGSLGAAKCPGNTRTTAILLGVSEFYCAFSSRMLSVH